MNHTSNWKPDPYGIHELRFFSADGKATLLVMDGGMTSYDKPPMVEQSPAPVPESPSSDLTGDDAQSDSRLEPPKTIEAGEGHFGGPIQSAARSSDAVVHNTLSKVDDRRIEPMGRPLKISFGIVLGLLAVSALGFIYVHVHHNATPSPIARTANGATRGRATTVTTTTEAALPTALQPSAEGAAAALVSSWSTGNRLAALSVATRAAATTLFATPYRSGSAIDRGCTTSFTPIVCTFGPPGGASPTDPIFQILVSHSSGGWYVSSVRIEN